jgi:hypothetical protein
MPLVERLSLWIVPALLFGVALFVDCGVRLARSSVERRNWAHLAVASGILFAAFQVGADIVANGIRVLAYERPAGSKQGIDDRSGVRWLMRDQREGDLLLTTHLGLPAVWWYAGASLANADAHGARLPDGTPIFEVAYASPGPECRNDPLRDVVTPARRVLVYFGFPDVPDGFDDLVVRSLSRFGGVAAEREFSLSSRAAVINIHQRLENAPAPASQLDGCLVVRRASPW